MRARVCGVRVLEQACDREYSPLSVLHCMQRLHFHSILNNPSDLSLHLESLYLDDCIGHSVILYLSSL